MNVKNGLQSRTRYAMLWWVKTSGQDASKLFTLSLSSGSLNNETHYSFCMTAK